MTEKLTNKLNRFTTLISKLNNDLLFNFWSEIISDMNFEFNSDYQVSEKGMSEFEIYQLNRKIAKLQIYIVMIQRAVLFKQERFIVNYDINKIFVRSKIYDDLQLKTFQYEFEGSPEFVPAKKSKYRLKPKPEPQQITEEWLDSFEKEYNLDFGIDFKRRIIAIQC